MVPDKYAGTACVAGLVALCTYAGFWTVNSGRIAGHDELNPYAENQPNHKEIYPFLPPGTHWLYEKIFTPKTEE